MPGARPIIDPHGGYRDLRAFHVAEAIYDGTIAFTRLYVKDRTRTVDQMVQAARSGKQNIAEGSRASGTSKLTEIRLTDVARASLDELLLDYEDFLRLNGYEKWLKDDPKAVYIRKLGQTPAGENVTAGPATHHSKYRSYVEEKGCENAANTLICLIHQANFLIDQLLRRLERDYANKGDIKERVTRLHRSQRSRTIHQMASQADVSDVSDLSNTSDLSDTEKA